MTNKEIKKICLEQCNSYYDYIKKFTEHHGKSAFKALQINQLDKYLFEIKLEKPIYNFETTYYKNNLAKDLEKQEYYFNKKDILIKEYDQKNRLLYVQVLNKDIDLKQLPAHEFLVISDLLFLVKNLIEWYEKYADKLKLSNPLCQIKNYSTSNLVDTILNDNQKLAVKTIFENSYSYIWGPPGTGKTRAVLSSSIINYINHNKKVLIVAPTNVALEQILFGVLENTQKLNISKETFLRVGIPSKNFFETHPQTCEIKGLETQIQSIENELNIIDKVIKYRQANEIIDDLKDVEILVKEIIDDKRKIKELETSKEELQPLLNLLTHPLKKYHFSNNCKILKDAIYKKKDLSCVNYDEKLIENNRLNEVVNISCLRNEIKDIDEQINLIVKASLKTLKQIKKFSKSPKITNEIFKDLDYENILEKRDLILKKIDNINIWAKKAKEELKNIKQNKDALISQALNEHHKDFDIKKLFEKKEEIENKKNSLLEQTTNIRIKQSQVIAMTIDNYIQYTLNEDIKVEHIFCDEAGYMSNIKALTLFKNPCPITFLGDHMQLPPVSEVSNHDETHIKKSFLWSQSSIFFESIFTKKNIEDLYEEFKTTQTPKYNITKQTNLNFTHRFGNNLASILDKFVYKFGFKSASNNSTRIISIHAPSNPKNGIDRSNFEEIQTITKLINKSNLKDFAILTPYNKQVNILRKTLPKSYSDNIMTIHKSQGSEWDTVIFSVVDDALAGSSKRGAFFTNSLNTKYSSLNLINTVVSRAKKRLIIIANHDFWLQDTNKQLIGNLIKISELKSID